MLTLRLYMLQRLSALVMVPLVIGHIAVMIYAVQGGLTAEEILARTKGSLAWAAFYGCFVLAAALHASIGLRTVVAETFGWTSKGLDIFSLAVGLFLSVLGLTAVTAVTL
ncbi:MAG: succinate dehydrogenase [Ahrensia sp.]|nr:succinate dehydrogenase [Ahrensia sp.]